MKNTKTHLEFVGNKKASSTIGNTGIDDSDELVAVLDVLGGAENAEEAFARLQAWNRSPGALKAGAYDVEQELLQGGMEVLRHMLAENFRSRGIGDVGPFILLDEQEEEDAIQLGHRRLRGRNYESIFGTIRLERLGYNARRQQSVHPLDEVLNLPQRKYSYVLQERGVRWCGHGPFDESLEDLLGPTQRKGFRDFFDSHFGIGGEVRTVFDTVFGVAGDDHSHELAAGDRVP